MRKTKKMQQFFIFLETLSKYALNATNLQTYLNTGGHHAHNT